MAEQQSIVLMSVSELRLHRAAELVPVMRTDEWQPFIEDVRQHGVREPVVVQEGGVILDGRHRWQAAKETGMAFVPARTVNLPPSDQIKYVIAAAVLRRHLSDDQRAQLAARLRQPMSDAVQSEKMAHAREVLRTGAPSISDTVSKIEPVDTRAVAAEQLNVPERKVRYAIELERSAPDLAQQVFAGETTLIEAKRELNERKREDVRKVNRALVEQAPAAPAIFPGQRFQVIVLDPPWDWGDEGDADQFGRARPTYATMPIEDIAALPVPDLAGNNAHIYLWITNRSLPKGFALLERWGFRYVTTLTWVKPSIGMGNYFRGTTEHVLFGVRGSLPLLRRDAATHFTAPRPGVHSGKPDAFYDLVESCSPGPWLEMFARRTRPGWIPWGAEVAGDAR